MATGLSVDDPRVVTATLERVTGIDFGCDLTLSWPYVLRRPILECRRAGACRTHQLATAIGDAFGATGLDTMGT